MKYGMPAAVQDRIRNPQYRGVAIEGRRRIVVFALIVCATVASDQITKALVLERVPVNDGFVVIDGYLNIVHARNPGAAFGMFAGAAVEFRYVFFIGVSFLALAVILYLMTRDPTPPFLLAGYALFFSGTLGNLIDRLRFGEVVDFIDVHIGQAHWPAFNAADSALCLGTACFVLYFLFSGRTPSGGDESDENRPKERPPGPA